MSRHAVAAALLRTGIDFQAVNKTFFRTKTKKRLALEAAMLSEIEYHDHGRVAVLAVPLSLIAKVQAAETDAEDLSALGGQIEGVDCAVTLPRGGGGGADIVLPPEALEGGVVVNGQIHPLRVRLGVLREQRRRGNVRGDHPLRLKIAGAPVYRRRLHPARGPYFGASA